MENVTGRMGKILRRKRQTQRSEDRTSTWLKLLGQVEAQLWWNYDVLKMDYKQILMLMYTHVYPWV